MEKTLMLLDPSLANRQGDLSRNLGDVIIQRAVWNELSSIFPADCIDRLSTHQPLTPEEYQRANRCGVRFVGGTNLLSSKNTKYTWYREEHRLNWLFPKLKPVTLFGVGWGVGYPQWRDWRPRYFFHRNLHSRHIHSVRDGFSQQMLQGIGIRNVLHTSCPTLWKLHGFQSNADSNVRRCVFTLTDYRKLPERDNAFLKTLLKLFPAELYFFPQGAQDSAYLETLPAFRAAPERILSLGRSIDQLEQFLAQQNKEFVFIGTRLHGGILAMQHGIKSLILSVDHRATEISKNVGLPIITEHFEDGIRKWLSGSLRFEPLQLPLKNIALWREYWGNFAACKKICS